MKKLLAMLLALCMLFSFAACAEKAPAQTEAQTSAQTDATENTEETTAAPTGDTIKIGCVLPLSGGSAYIGELEKEGVQYCVDHYNEMGGIGGKQIEVIFADSTGTADVAVTELERLITNEGIIAVTGPFNSAVAVAMAPICEKYQIPFSILGAASIEVLQQGYTYTFRAGNTANTNTDALVGICNEISEKFGDEIKNIAILYVNGEWGVSQSESFKTLFEGANMNIVFNETFEPGTSDFSSIITKLKQSGAQIVIPVIDNFSDAILFTRQMKEYKANIALMCCGGVMVLPEFIETLGDDANKIFSTDVWNADFLANLRGDEAVALHQGYVDQYGHKMGEQAGMAWVATVTLLEAMNRASDLSNTSIRDSLASLEIKADEEAALLLPYEVKFGEVDNMTNQNIYAFSMASQVIDQEWHSVYPDEILGSNPITWPILDAE